MPDNFASSHNPDGACCDQPPGCPAYVVRVVGNPVAGLAVTLAGTLDGQPWSATGVTGADGTYTYIMPDQAPYPVATSATVTAPDVGPSKGCKASANFGTACMLSFTHCRAAVRATFTPEVNPRLTASGSQSAPIAWMVTRDDAAGVIVWDSCCLKAGVDPTPPPQVPRCPALNQGVTFRADDLNFNAPSRAGRPPRCQVVPIKCGVFADIDLTQEPYPECYTLGSCGPVPCRSDVGPPYVGARPRRIQVRLTEVGRRTYFTDGFTINPNPPCDAAFGSDDGQWIELYDLDSGARGSAGNYASGMVAVNTNTGSAVHSWALNAPCSVYNEYLQNPPWSGQCGTIAYDSTRVRVTSTGGGNSLRVNYFRDMSPTNPQNSADFGVTCGALYAGTPPKFYTNGTCSDFNANGTIPVAALCVPIPTGKYRCTGLAGYKTSGVVFDVEFRDACPAPTTPTTPTGTTTFRAAAPVMMAAADPELVPLDESIRLHRAAKACPHRTEPSCGCPGTPGACAMGKNGAKGVTLADCVACQAAGGPDGPWPEEDDR